MRTSSKIVLLVGFVYALATIGLGCAAGGAPHSALQSIDWLGARMNNQTAGLLKLHVGLSFICLASLARCLPFIDHSTNRRRRLASVPACRFRYHAFIAG